LGTDVIDDVDVRTSFTIASSAVSRSDGSGSDCRQQRGGVKNAVVRGRAVRSVARPHRARDEQLHLRLRTASAEEQP
jgi:hypothetical protein